MNGSVLTPPPKGDARPASPQDEALVFLFSADGATVDVSFGPLPDCTGDTRFFAVDSSGRVLGPDPPH